MSVGIQPELPLTPLVGRKDIRVRVVSGLLGYGESMVAPGCLCPWYVCWHAVCVCSHVWVCWPLTQHPGLGAAFPSCSTI